MKSKVVVLAVLFLFVVGVFSVAPAFSISVSAEPISIYEFARGRGPVTPCGDPVPGTGSGGGD